ncbi:hypothetical protein RHGRI_011953 [Rhododendron griersonianum]|uniref:F-box domain-containing protein n=1 Tax=Rhododendron griersonianum TaxID=479676 RepID=A0AAV6KNP7_9ERIC|nr:hypothetical protein RHGRI_011953 [Rhododendron griersonianum]
MICIFFWLTRTNLGSKSKRHKLSKKQNVLQVEDRISNLPGNLISRILSSLPTKSAVATSVLSTRWKQFWTLVTSLEFDCRKVCFLNSPYFHFQFVQSKFSCYSRIFDQVECRGMKHVQEMDSELPVFPNLTSLVLGAGYVGWEWLSQFLEKSPCLESLVFKEGYQSDHYRDEYYEEGDSEGDDKPLLCRPPENVPSCLRSNLKIIKFVNFQGDDGELKMVEYFLKNAEVLGAAGLAVAKQQLEVTTNLLMLPRSSKTCQIEFVIRRYNFCTGSFY